MLEKAVKKISGKAGRSMSTRLLLAIITLATALPGLSQVGHPAKGSWSGWLGHDSADQQRIRLLIDDHNGELDATINPGRRGVDASTVTLDASDWSLTIEADMPDGKLVLDGTLSNLGSWANRKYTGTYTMGGNSGSFDITLN